ncbi:OprD family outer membrane porin [Shewanella sp. Isolate11]|uniref:OprD family outer membrane porin n=1 Tax=Shewanella sp. Isolate11 TaxID=2908530 RepID=UPI001EFCF6F0|nr:OprD family outer membrane porin [Shewanella sp. Isolate11]MCG9695655.1 OprD family porin [Shewanella sp. Isolate11]
MMKKKYISLLIMSAISIPAVADTTIDKMFSEGNLRGEMRLYDFTRDFDGVTNTKHDTSFGGLFYYNTAAVNGISFGTSFASSNPIWIDDSASVYGLVGRDGTGAHDSVNRLQEYFVQGEWFDTKLKYGAQELRTPMMNPHDIRAIPRTFRGFSAVNNSVENLTLSALYITDSMGWSDESFVSVKEAVEGDLARAGVIADVADNPVIAFGAKYKLPFDAVKASANVWHYRMEDVFNQTYAKLELSKQLGDVNVYFNPSYLTQQSSGDETAGELDTYQYGAHLGVMFSGLNLTYLYAKTGDDTVLTPWGDDKVVIQQVYQSARGEETVNAARVAYDFSNVGVKGLNAYVFYGEYDVPDSASGSDFSELDFSVSYALDNVLKGLSVRARHAIVDFDTGEDLQDTRFYLKYKFNLSGL